MQAQYDNALALLNSIQMKLKEDKADIDEIKSKMTELEAILADVTEQLAKEDLELEQKTTVNLCTVRHWPENDSGILSNYTIRRFANEGDYTTCRKK